ncbi:MAG TPA: SDR family oxidoreductase [Candidatus Limnocylindrales bacterium]|nr:SDR family oxidoreductase [Candidatus Limnocylindrales bacterium]
METRSLALNGLKCSAFAAISRLNQKFPTFSGSEESPLTNLSSKLNPFRLDGKVAVITGAASGIGRAIALRFAENGAEVHLLDRNEPDARKVALEISSAGGSATVFQCDVTEAANVKAVFEKIAAAGPLHILVNSAGVSNIGKLETTSEEDFERLFRVNVKGTFLCMKAAVEVMKPTGGAIVNLASIAGSAALPDRFAYSMTKGGVIAMTLSVAQDYLRYKIRCNCISPARIHTPFVDDYLRKNYPGREAEMFGVLSKAQPIGRMGEPEEVAALALFLCSDEASFVTGADYPLDGGFFNLR